MAQKEKERGETIEPTAYKAIFNSKHIKPGKKTRAALQGYSQDKM